MCVLEQVESVARESFRHVLREGVCTNVCLGLLQEDCLIVNIYSLGLETCVCACRRHVCVCINVCNKVGEKRKEKLVLEVYEEREATESEVCDGFVTLPKTDTPHAHVPAVRA